jgi:hypothetical protein
VLLLPAAAAAACCCCCCCRRRLGACELPDDDHFCCLEALLMQLGVREVALPKLGTGKEADAGKRSS